jgi:endonuclease YncB( thermonuclease family)
MGKAVPGGALAALLSLAVMAHGHGGGLDGNGCHHDRKRGGYHCHRSPAAALYSPAPRAAGSAKQTAAPQVQPLYGAPHATAGCKADRRGLCVIDGDTIVWRGETVRLRDIDAPELYGRCEGEKALAAKAALHLRMLLDTDDIVLQRDLQRPLDPDGRTLGDVLADGIDVGDIMIVDKLARPWRGRRESWCD